MAGVVLEVVERPTVSSSTGLVVTLEVHEALRCGDNVLDVVSRRASLACRYRSYARPAVADRRCAMMAWK